VAPHRISPMWTARYSYLIPPFCSSEEPPKVKYYRTNFNGTYIYYTQNRQNSQVMFYYTLHGENPFDAYTHMRYEWSTSLWTLGKQLNF
jgi:hypothetical protein